MGVCSTAFEYAAPPTQLLSTWKTLCIPGKSTSTACFVHVIRRDFRRRNTLQNMKMGECVSRPLQLCSEEIKTVPVGTSEPYDSTAHR